MESNSETAAAWRWQFTLFWSGFGIFTGLLCATLVLAPVSQCLLDWDDDDVVLATILYFKWAACACYLISGTLGAIAGKALAKSFDPSTLSHP